MPDKHGNLSARELHDRLEQRREHRDDLRGERKRLRDRLRKIAQRIDRAGKKIKHLSRRYQKAKKREQPAGAQDAVASARSMIGRTESPPGSNLGPGADGISAMQVYTGYAPPVFWCGCAVCWWVVKIGAAKILTRVRLGYHGYIIDDARAGRNGLREVPVEDAKPGDIVAYDFAHIGLIVGPTVGGMVHTIEGNTSSQDGGSQNNGGGIYERRRPISDVAVIARPAY